MDERNKWAFWAAAGAALLLVCIPSATFLDALSRYRRYLSGVDASTLRPSRVRFIPHRGGKRVEPKKELDFVDFALKRPKARRVELAGDFNGWNEKALPMLRGDDGSWQVSVPLPKGRHLYLFVIDGQAELDPANPETAVTSGRKASVRVVK
jgi:1,4-alpha-glucan branching enzyme